MRILIVSDTHRHNENYFRALERVGQVHMVIHCGDAEGSEYILQEAAGVPLHIVMGNNDFFPTFQENWSLKRQAKRYWLPTGIITA